jgi:cytoskeletal protein RodZ
VPEGDKFCPRCGVQVEAAPAGPPPAPAPPQAQPPQPPPAPGPVPPPAPPAPAGTAGPIQKKRMSKGAKLAIWLGVLTIVLILIAVILLAVFVINVVSGPADAANSYVKALQEGDLSTAWGYLSASTQSEEGRSGFESKVGIFEGEIKTWNTGSIEINNSNARVVMDLSFKDGTDATWDMYLVKEDGEWKIDQVSPRT